jgi:GT2 family glycosyltransferase
LQIFVLGMHRSGTSVVTRLINLMGAYFGPERSSTGASWENPKGFWERRDVRDENDAVLWSADADWWKVADFDIDQVSEEARARFDCNVQKIVRDLDAHRPWVLKEPRFCLLFSMWRKYVATPVCVIVHRSPAQIAHSLERRNGFPVAFGVALWERYILDALSSSVGVPRVVVSYERIMSNPIGEADNLRIKLAEAGVEGLYRPSEADIEGFVSSDLFHHRQTDEEHSGLLTRSQAELKEALEDGSVLHQDDVPPLSAQSADVLRLHEEVAGSKDKITEERLAARKLSKTIETQRRNTKEITKDLRTLNTRIEAQDHEMDVLRRDRATALADRDALRDRVAVGESEIVNLRTELDNRATAIEQLKSTKSELDTALSDSRSARSNLEGQLNHLHDALAEKGQEHQKAQQKLNHLEIELDHALEKAENEEHGRLSATARVSELTARVEELTARLNDRAAHVEELTVRVSERSARVEELTVQVNDRSTQLEALAARIKDLDSQIENQLARVKELEHVSASRGEDLRNLKERLKEEETTNAEERTMLVKQLEKTETARDHDIQVLTAKVRNAKDAHDADIEKLKTLERACDRKRVRVAELQTSAKELERDRDRWRLTTRSAMDRIRRHESSLVQLLAFLREAQRHFQIQTEDAGWRVGPFVLSSRRRRDAGVERQARFFRDVGHWVRGNRRDIVAVLERGTQDASRSDDLESNIDSTQASREMTRMDRSIGELAASIPKPQSPSLDTRNIEMLDIDVVVCVHNCFEQVRRCLKSVLPTLASHHQLIVVDDGSDAETAGFLRRLAQDHDCVRLIRRGVAEGYTKAANRGIQESTGDFVILLNSDTEVPQKWLNKLATAAFGSNEVGIVGPLSNAATWQSVPEIVDSDGRLAVNRMPPGLSVEDMDWFAETNSPSDFPRLSLVNGFCLGIKREVIDSIGSFDEGLFPDGYGEEIDLCLRAEEAGFGNLIATNCYVYHEKSSSYTPAKRDVLVKNSNEALSKKYSTSRIANAVKSCKADPILVALRARFRALDRRPQIALERKHESRNLSHDKRNETVASHVQSRGSADGAIQKQLVFPDVKVDVIVAVHNALDDVRRCLESVVRHMEANHHLIIVNDGSDSMTTEYLKSTAKKHGDCVTLLENETARGYTYAANTGLRESSGDYVVLLNSDTIVPQGWLTHILTCGQGDPKIGILGPLSNSASYQSIPVVRLPSMDWALNEMPRGYTVDKMARLVGQVSERRYPRVPFINGFCYVIKRQVIDAIGLFDEENFGRGYAEENDYSARAAKAGFSLAIVDDAYVYHARSKSYSRDRRRRLTRSSRISLNEKHGADYVLERIRLTEEGSALLDGMRKRLTEYLKDPRRTLRRIRVLWLLMDQGGGGGAHSIVQEAVGMNMLPNVRSEVAVRREMAERAMELYSDMPSDTFFFFDNEAQLIDHAKTFDIAVATHFLTFPTLERIYRTPGTSIQPAYYIQDYEPRFISPKRPELIKQAESTYTALPSIICFAKTEWLRTVLREEHGIELFKVTPSLDTGLYRPRRRGEDTNGPVRITAMVRPTTPRRAPAATMRLLKTIKERHGGRVRITVFGNDPQSEMFQRLPRDFEFQNRGILKRAEVAALLSDADIFVDLSRYQAFGRTAAEAMAVGCAVIVPREGGVHEYAVDGENALIVDSEDMEESVAALDRLVTDGKLRRRLARSAVNISTRFNLRAAAWSEIDLMRAELMKRTVSIIVPVYNALQDTLVCLESVVRNTHGPYRLFVIDDGSPDPDVWPALQRFARRNQQTAKRNDRNLGFTATINKGCRMVDGDVVVLNSDTCVTDEWLDKLRQAAYSRERVATVTPLSNAAGAFSLPDNNKINPIPEGMTLEQIARLVAKESRRLRPEVPTGNGYCMFIRREALDQIGDFDEEAFPNGYGEENDFCQRSITAGFVNLIDDATFIYHKRTASFKERKNAIIAESMKVINQRWPGYSPSVKHWLTNDPLDPFRDHIKDLIEYHARPKTLHRTSDTAKAPSLLFVIHMGKGGTLLTNRDLMAKLGQHYNCHLLITGVDKWLLYDVRGDEQVLLEEYKFNNRWQIDDALKGQRLQALHDIRKRSRPEMVHIRHLLGNHPDIVRILKCDETPVIISLHDYYTICPTINLVDNEKKYCAGVCSATPGQCRTSPTWFSTIPPLKNDHVWRWQDTVAPALAMCDAVVVTSPTTQQLVQSHYRHLPEHKFHLIEHGRDMDAYQWVSEPPTAGQPVRLVIFGALGPNKGITLVGEMLKMNGRDAVSIHVDILGDTNLPFDPDDFDSCDYHGGYERDQLPGLLASLRPSLALIPSIWPETFCHALTEAWAAGLPVLGSNLGAVGERIARLGGGWVLDPRDPTAWMSKIGEIARSPEEYERRRTEIRAHPRRTVADMAQDYLRLYRWVAYLNDRDVTPMATGLSHRGDSNDSNTTA